MLFFRYLNSSSFLCDCQLEWLSTWLLQKTFHNMVTAVCVYPPNLIGRSIFLVQGDEFKCGKLIDIPNLFMVCKLQNIVIANASLSTVFFKLNFELQALWMILYFVISDRWGFPEALHNIPPQDKGGSEEWQHHPDLSSGQYRGLGDGVHLEKGQCGMYPNFVFYCIKKRSVLSERGGLLIFDIFGWEFQVIWALGINNFRRGSLLEGDFRYDRFFYHS